MRILILLVVLAVSIIGCKNDTAAKKSAENKETVTVDDKYKLIAFKPSTEYSDAKINGYTFSEGNWNFDVSGTDYKLGEQTPDAAQKMCANSGKGQHIHLIVDDKPYSAQYTNKFKYDLEDGAHHILAFLSRSYHESIKTTAASTMKTVSVKDGKIGKSKDIVDPMLFYSRPKGTYVGKDTEKVMLDFYIGNTTLGENKVKVDINGEEHTVDKWQPYYITGLPMGQNTVTLTLVDANGKKIDAPLNPVSRTFTLKAEPAMEG